MTLDFLATLGEGQGMTDTHIDDGDFVPFSDEYKATRQALTPDGWLSVMVDQCENTGIEMGVTLTVGGAIISGVLIGRTKWTEELAEFGEGNFFAKAIRDANEELTKPGGEDDDEPAFESFIHLREARFWSPRGPITKQGSLWRGRLSEVQGWSLGVLTTSAE